MQLEEKKSEKEGERGIVMRKRDSLKSKGEVYVQKSGTALIIEFIVNCNEKKEVYYFRFNEGFFLSQEYF